MRIKYNVHNKNRFKTFNDSMGVALNRKNIIESRKLKYMKYTTASIMQVCISFVFLGLMLILLNVQYCLMSVILVWVAVLTTIFMVLNVLYPLIFATLFIGREQNELEINEKGISFYFEDDECITLGWTHVKALIIGKYSLNFITDDFYYFYLDKKYRKQVIDAIKEYNESLLIIK